MERKAGWREVALLVGSAVLAALLLEALARVWIGLRWPEERVAQMTVEGPYRGRFEIASPMGTRCGRATAPRPTARSSPTTLGFRGEELTREKPQGQIRIAMMGGSTVYGLVVSDPQTGAAVLQRTLRSLLASVQAAAAAFVDAIYSMVSAPLAGLVRPERERH